MAFWNLNKSPQSRGYREQIREYELEGKPFTKAVLLSALPQFEAARLAGGEWEDLNSAILSCASLVAHHITFTAMKSNNLIWELLTPGLVIRQPKIRAIITFNVFIQLCLDSHLKGEGTAPDINKLSLHAIRLLFAPLAKGEWDRIFDDLFQLVFETFNELSKVDSPQLNTWKETMSKFVPGYILFDRNSPQSQDLNLPYPWLFEQQLAALVGLEEGKLLRE